MQSAGWSYRAALTLTRLAIAVVNSINCTAEPSPNFSERGSSLWRNLFYISAGLCPEVARLSGIFSCSRSKPNSAVLARRSFVLRRHAVMQLLRSCAEGALFIALVSVDNLTGRGTRPLLPTLSELLRPEFPGVFRGARCGWKNAHCTWDVHPRRQDDSCRTKIVSFLATHT